MHIIWQAAAHFRRPMTIRAVASAYSGACKSLVVQYYWYHRLISAEHRQTDWTVSDERLP